MKQLTWVCVCLLWISCGLAAQSNPVPYINQPLVPASAAPGSGAFTLTVNGSGFAPTAAVRWNGSLRPTAVLSSTRLQASIRASDVGSIQTARVAVVNVDAHNETSDVAFFPVRRAAPGVALGLYPNFLVTGTLVLGDFNNDGKLDIVNLYVTDSGESEADVYLSTGNGQFEPPVQNMIDNRSFDLTVAIKTGDFNGDHDLDLVVVSHVSRIFEELDVLLGDGTGKLTLQPGLQDTFQALALGVADLNGDGNLDVMYLDSHKLHVYLGNGDGTFRATGDFCSCGSPVVGDFNEDGYLDIAFPGIGIAINRGDGTFKQPVEYRIPSSAIVAADVNGDGHLDLVTDRGGVLLGKGDGRFTVGGTGGETSGTNVVAGDLNGDGKLDVVVFDSAALESVSILLGNGDSTFQPAIVTAFSSGSNTGPQGIGIGDFNGDGRLDLVDPNGLFLQVPANLSPVSLAFGKVLVGTTSPSQTSTLVNYDSKPLLGVAISLTGTDAQEFSQTNNCPSRLPVRGSCQIQITFAPTSVGDKTASLNATYNGPGSPQSVALSGTGVPGTSVSLLPTTLTFASENLNTTSAPQTATLMNTGGVDVTVSKISAGVPFLETNNCPSTLPVGQSCLIQVTFHPTTIGQKSGTLSVTDSAPDSPQTVALSGVGSLITLSPIGINFGTQKVGTSSNPVPVTLSNKGATTLNISQIGIGGTNPSDFSQTNNCGSSLPAGSQCTIQVTFTPTQTGTRSAQLQVQDDVNPGPQTVSLNGTGT